jgi:flagellar hook-associated protein 2
MGISMTGIGSGMDVDSIISSLMEVEKITYDKLAVKKSNINFDLSAVGSIKSGISDLKASGKAVSDFVSKSYFNTKQSSSTSFTSSLDGNDASLGSYDITVTQLAQAHKIGSAVQTSKTADTGLTGTMSIDVGGTSFDVEIDPANDTLEEIRDTINNASDNSGVKASILATNNEITGDPEYVLTLTSTTTGADNSIAVTDSVGTMAATLNITAGTANELNVAQNAIIDIDGYNVERATNTLSDVIEGVTLDLIATGGAASLEINSELRKDDIKELIGTFVSDYNAIVSKINELDAESNETTVSLLKSKLRSVLDTPATGTGIYNIMADLGIVTDSPAKRISPNTGVEFTNGGLLKLDSTVLDSVMGSNYDDVINLLTDATEGFLTRFDGVFTEMVTSGGTVDTTLDQLGNRTKYLDDRLEREETRLERKEKSLTKQFSKLDSLMSTYQQQGAYVTAQLGAWASQDG